MVAAVALASLLVSSSLAITVDATLLNDFLARNYPAIEILPSLTLERVHVSSIEPSGLAGSGSVRFRGRLPMPVRLPWLGQDVSWDFTVPVTFRCRPRMSGTVVVVPISTLSFSMMKGPTISLAVFEAFQRWWNMMVRSRVSLELRALDVGPILRRYFGRGRWNLTLKYSRGTVTLLGTRR